MIVHLYLYFFFLYVLFLEERKVTLQDYVIIFFDWFRHLFFFSKIFNHFQKYPESITYWTSKAGWGAKENIQYRIRSKSNHCISKVIC
jgi:hypothetical protein